MMVIIIIMMMTNSPMMSVIIIPTKLVRERPPVSVHTWVREHYYFSHLDRLASGGIIIIYIIPGEAVVAILLVCTVTEDGRVGVWVYFGVDVTTIFILEGALSVVVLGGDGVIALVLLIWRTVRISAIPLEMLNIELKLVMVSRIRSRSESRITRY